MDMKQKIRELITLDQAIMENAMKVMDKYLLTREYSEVKAREYIDNLMKRSAELREKVRAWLDEAEGIAMIEEWHKARHEAPR